MKRTRIVLCIALIATICAGCSKKMEGSYKGRSVLFGQSIETIYDFNKDGTVVMTNFLGGRYRGKYSISGNKIHVTFKPDWDMPDRELIREGDALMDGDRRFTRQ